MSNTIRRKTVKTPNWYHNNWVKGTMINNPSVPGTKNWAKEEAFFHGDKFQPDARVERQNWGCFKVSDKREIHKYMKDSEYEPQIQRGRATWRDS